MEFFKKILSLGTVVIGGYHHIPQHPGYDEIWNFTPIIFFSTLRIFYVEMATSEGWGVWIYVVRKQPRIHVFMNSPTNLLVFKINKYEVSRQYDATTQSLSDLFHVQQFSEVHTEKYFRNLVNPNQFSMVITTSR